MRDEQLTRLLDALTANQTPEAPQRNGIGETLSKIGIALCTASILWVGAQVTSLDKSMAVIIQSQEFAKEDMQRFNEFIKEPRFTEQSFEYKIAPIKQRLEIYSVNVETLQRDTMRMQEEFKSIQIDIRKILRKMEANE